MKQKLYLFMFALLSITFAKAQTFIYNGINYTVTDATNFKVEVSNNVSFSGVVANIPATVIYNSQNYDVTSIGVYAFQNATSLRSVTIPNSVTSIGSGAFSECGYLGSVTIPNSVTSIGDGAFFECVSLESVTIPNSVTSIGFGAFQDATSLTSVTIPNSVTSIGDYIFYGCKNLRSVTIPNSVTSIGNSTFTNCTFLTSVTIPNSVTSIGNNTFANCTTLTSVTIPNSVTSIGFYAFDRCISLASVTIPNSVTSIGALAFNNCFSLTTVNCYVQNPIVINANVFGGTTNQAACALNVPIGSEAAYEAAAVWTNFNPINGVLATDSFVKNSFTMYPNPTTGIFNISIQEDANVTVNDLLGKVIYSNKVKAGNNTIDISNYQSGIYLLNIANENGSVTKKLVKE